MSLFVPGKATPIDLKQGRLMQLAAVFLLLFSITLTLAPAARYHTWDAPYRWGHWIGFVVWLISAGVAHRLIIRLAPNRDPYLFPTAALLSGWGLLTIWRLDTVNGARQTAWLVVGLAAVIGGLRAPDLLGQLRRYKYLWLTGGLLLTGLTFRFGTYPGGVGPRLWLGCCGVYLQPSEPLKLLLIVYLAAYLADRLPVSFRLTTLLTPTLVLIGMALALLLAQRDLGTASLFILIYTIIIYLASRRRRILIISALVLIASALLGYQLFDVVRVRVDAWINPWLDPSGRSYQIVQSLIAVASGGFLGRGPGLGNPGVVPVAHSDFVFAAIVEETGLLGAVALVLLFALLVERGFRAAMFAPNNYRRYLAAGISAYLAMQGILIAGGNLRLLPLTGVTLPFVSYGGSSLLTASLSVMILLLVSAREEDEEPAPLPTPVPYLIVGSGLLAGLVALALFTGWWTVARRDALVARPDNPRRVIDDRFVTRGALLDRNNLPLSRTEGKSGSYTRVYGYPPLSATTGYTSPLYGQSGLEAGLDPYLRGLAGNPSSLIMLDDLLYGQPPPGLDVRLSIDLDFQKQADTLMQAHKGALVLMNAKSGEILAMVSHPYYDPNLLDQTWGKLINDPNAPLLNRATQGAYPPGAALGPFLFGAARSSGNGTDLTGQTSFTGSAGTFDCAVQPPAPLNNGKMIANGCPGALATLSRALGAQSMTRLFSGLGFYEAPGLPLASNGPSEQVINQVELAGIGQESLTVTPVQMALAAAALTNNGQRPAPRLAQSYLSPSQGWTLFPSLPDQDTGLTKSAQPVIQALKVDGKPIWQTVALARSSQEELTWFIGGSLPEKPGVPIAIALILEEQNPSLAEQIGQDLLEIQKK